MYPLLVPRRGFLAQWILENLRKIAPLYDLHYEIQNIVPVRFVDVEKTEFQEKLTMGDEIRIF